MLSYYHNEDPTKHELVIVRMPVGNSYYRIEEAGILGSTCPQLPTDEIRTLLYQHGLNVADLCSCDLDRLQQICNIINSEIASLDNAHCRF